MKRLHRDSYEQMISGATVISRDLYGDKVLKLLDGRMAKLFRLKRKFSSALVYPYAKRFERAARNLRKLNIPSVHVIDIFRVKSIARDVVLYNPLEGKTLREVLESSENKDVLLKNLAIFLAKLHDKGIYFRSIHFDNIILLSNGKFGLIDISDLRISLSSLRLQKRIRNFKHIFRYKEDREAILDFGIDFFFDSYIENSDLSQRFRRSLLRHLKSLCLVNGK